jgi:hypothetical protein
MKILMKFCVLLIVIPAMSLLAQPKKWPPIQPLEERHVFSNIGENNADTLFIAFIKDIGGIPIYKLECHSGNYEDESEINWSGDFQCALFAIRGRVPESGNLLASNTKNERSTDWWNRGRMRSAQLRGQCLLYPNYSTDRQFRLRGMLITLRFTDIQWSARKDEKNEPLLSKFEFTVSVMPEEAARSASAERGIGPQPPAFCYP